ncbi:MAG: thiosulfate oxidation carrier protein SoxY [Pseudomonadota bacterium]|nr:thiosulfate oxidation carrier protein SoxY [Pseudomonadota bacterium]
MTTLDRRSFLKSSLAGSALALSVAAGLLSPRRVLAAMTWPAAAFDATSATVALKALYGRTDIPMSPKVHIRAPIQAENGAVVPIQVSADLPDVESIGILVDKNPTPLVTHVHFANGARGFFMARMKMGKTSPVRVIVKAGGRLYQASQSIKVTVGGCGG